MALVRLGSRRASAKIELQNSMTSSRARWIKRLNPAARTEACAVPSACLELWPTGEGSGRGNLETLSLEGSP
jgi:hypothetical protein